MGGIIGDFVRGVTGLDASDKDLSGLGMAMIPGVGQYMGAKEANVANAAMSDKQMSFQERMSNTAHQREAVDLEKAGFNKILSVGNSGASTPPGSMATMQNAAEGVAASAKEAFQAYQQARKQREEIALLQAQKDNVNMDTKVKSKGVPEADMKNKFYDLVKPWVDKLHASTASAPKSEKKKAGLYDIKSTPGYKQMQLRLSKP